MSVLKPEVTFISVPMNKLEKDSRQHMIFLDQQDITALKSPPTQSFIESTSRYIVKFISTALYSQDNLEHQQKKTEMLFLKINNFFCYLRQFANLTGTELVYTTFLAQKLIESEKQDLDEDKDSITVTESNIGTVLICAAILAMKMIQDVVEYKNCWWAKAFGMNLDLLNQSEMAFFNQLNFSIALERKQFIRLYSQIVQTSES
ncbi:MAG: hypothetical protein EZS28_040501 [Streblomastix strix]|uniref:Cyclin N-terminal domain-containing protein n=1 Tax=Streblomastix strix TaxID=222440 RepID=A0A5J4U1T0_9EUKA|nr:MAG: hypothetical protein EZS28_040501 [Streblomastix strix]